jgi:hypothetical protein
LTSIHPHSDRLLWSFKGSEHQSFGDILEVEVLHPVNNTSTTAPGSSQNVGGASSTQTNGGAPHQSLTRASLPRQVIQDNTELEQIQVEDWEDEAYEIEAAEEAELVRVQQELDRLHQEQEALTRRQAEA